MIFVVSMLLMHVPFTGDLPSPLVDCGVIINAKEDLYEINFCQIIHCMLVRKRAVDGP